MRMITIGILLCAFAAMTASAGVGTTPEKRGEADMCAANNAEAVGSCAQLPPGAVGQSSAIVVYVDTGRADGRPGVWQESNSLTGLQKHEYYVPEEIPADALLL